MRHARPARLAAWILAAALAACGRGPELDERPGPAAGSNTSRPAAAATADAKPPAEAAVQRRYLAVRHTLAIQTAAEGTQAAWRQANEACAAVGCEVLNSTLEQEDSRRSARATLEARVPPEQLDAFLKQIGGLGTVRQHSKTAEDKTDEVLDTEARLKNMTAFRDRLRQMLVTPQAKLQDLIEVERELAKVQGDLDSLASRRKALANQTDKVWVSIGFSEPSSVSSSSAWYPIRSALSEAGQLLASSVGWLISTVVAVLPWALLLLALGVPTRALWRRRRQRS